jgi:hypothetical protein
MVAALQASERRPWAARTSCRRRSLSILEHAHTISILMEVLGTELSPAERRCSQGQGCAWLIANVDEQVTQLTIVFLLLV